MSQVDARQDQDKLAILGDVVREIAVVSNPEASLVRILDAICDMTGALGGCACIFEDPSMQVNYGEEREKQGDQVRAVAESLEAGIYFNPPGLALEPCMLAHIVVRNKRVGVILMYFDVLPDDTHNPTLDVLIDCISIVVNQIRMKARHEKLSRNQSEFMRIVSHDLRTPLTSMKGFASMLESGMVGEFNEQQAHFVDKILTGIGQMSSIVDNFQDAGRYDPETGFYEMERSPCDVADMVTRIVNGQLLPAEKQNLKVRVKVNDNVPIISADVNMLERAIINLVDNAIKYTPDGGEVEVGVELVEEHVLISVRDDGLGISPENQKMLFERHVRIPRKEHKRIKGSGLGLFIVRSVAQRHGGDAWVESVEGDGSTFFIKVPLDDRNAIVSDS